MTLPRAVVSLIVFRRSPSFAARFVSLQSSVLVRFVPWTAVAPIDC